MVDTLSLEISINLMFFLERNFQELLFQTNYFRKPLIDQEYSCFHRFFFLNFEIIYSKSASLVIECKKIRIGFWSIPYKQRYLLV